MELDIAIKGMLEVENGIRSAQAISNPVLLSTHMMRLSAYTSAVEEKLAELEKDFEVGYAVELKERLIDKSMKVTQAEREVDIILAETKGQIKYLTRIVGSAWRQVGTIQSRINHIKQESGTNI